MSKKRVLSGIRATGRLHLGNYLGAVKGMLALQDDPDYETLYMVADAHTLTTPYKVKELMQNRREVILDYLAAGLDPEKSILFIQSMVPEHFELAFYFSSVLTVARMQHLPTFKDKVKQYPDQASLALLNYPSLMAADILIYGADAVPVGIDQEPHLEIAREVARKMNVTYGLPFPEPQRFATSGEYVPSLSGEGKMSKSVKGSFINLTDSLDEIVTKIARVPTDEGMGSAIPTDGGVASLFALIELFQGEEVRAGYEKSYMDEGVSYKTLKQELAEAIFSELEPLQKRRKELSQDASYVDSVILEGASRAQLIARETLTQVRRKLGLYTKLKAGRKPVISFEDFMKLDIRVGTVLKASVPEGSDKLIRQEVDFGDDLGKRVIFSGIKAWYKPEDIEGRQLPYVVNLAPRKMMGEESQGMLMAAAPDDEEHRAVLFAIDDAVHNGTMVV